MNNSMMSKKKMMQFVRETGFAMLDAGLYLDTHPCDDKAMDYYNKYQQMHKEAVHDYENHWTHQQYLPDALKNKKYYNYIAKND